MSFFKALVTKSEASRKWNGKNLKIRLSEEECGNFESLEALENDLRGLEAQLKYPDVYWNFSSIFEENSVGRNFFPKFLRFLRTKTSLLNLKWKFRWPKETSTQKFNFPAISRSKISPVQRIKRNCFRLWRSALK